MSKQLREGIEKLKQFYIKKIQETRLFEKKPHELQSLTLSELEIIYKRILRD